MAVSSARNATPARVVAAAAIAAALALPGIARAAGDVERGRKLAYTCHGCHGIESYRNAYPNYSVPRLGGQNADYIEVALQGYRRGTRGHETMQAQAASLTDQDIADVAAYFSGLAGEPSTGKISHDALKVEAGKQKAAACVQCHGAEGVAAAPQWPNLAGQHESYLLQALTQYKSGERKDMIMNPMVAPLDEAAIEELAAYFASQPHLHDISR